MTTRTNMEMETDSILDGSKDELLRSEPSDFGLERTCLQVDVENLEFGGQVKTTVGGGVMFVSSLQNRECYKCHVQE